MATKDIRRQRRQLGQRKRDFLFDTATIPIGLTTGGLWRLIPSIGINPLYFRTHFTSPQAGRAFIRLTYLVDDGAAFYINGVEIPGTRYNLALGGEVAYNQLAISPVVRATNCLTATGTITNMLVGDNVLAVELHQGAVTDDNDLVMGVRMDAIFSTACTLPTPPRPRLSITRMPATGIVTNLNIRWTNGPIFSVTNNGFALEGQTGSPARGSKCSYDTNMMVQPTSQAVLQASSR